MFENLPIEMLLKICKLLSNDDLFRAGQVCKELNIAVKDVLQ